MTVRRVYIEPSERRSRRSLSALTAYLDGYSENVGMVNGLGLGRILDHSSIIYIIYVSLESLP